MRTWSPASTRLDPELRLDGRLDGERVEPSSDDELEALFKAWTKE